MKIGTKIYTGFSIVIVLTIVLTLLSLNVKNKMNNSINEISNDRVPKTIWANKIIIAIKDASHVLKDIIISNDTIAYEEKLKDLDIHTQIVNQMLDSLKNTIASENGKEMLNILTESRENYIKARNEVIDAIKNKNIPEAKILLFSVLEKSQTDYVKYSNELINYQVELANKAALEADYEYNTTLLIIAVISGLTILIAIIIALIITRGITGPLKLCVDAANKLSEGNTNIKLETKIKDETAVLFKSMNNMAYNISSLVKDANYLGEAAMSGKLDVRIDATKYSGEYQNLINSFNGTLDAVISPLNVAAEYIDRISKGEIPPKITDEYKGDFNEIKNNLNSCIDGLQGLVEARNILANIVINDYNKNVNGNYLGIFADVADSVNGILVKLKGITSLCIEVSNGDLRQINDLRKEGKRCEYDNLNPSLLKMMETIQQLVEETVNLANAGADGKLNVRGDKSKFKGEYVKVVEGFNKTMDNIINPLNEAGEVLSIYASGDLTPRMTGNYNGDFAIYKDNINSLGESLSNVIREVLDAVQSTASAAIQISSTAETMAVSAEEQSKQSDEVASAVEEMARTITENAMNAGRTAEVAEKNGYIANEGGQVVAKTVEKMKDIAIVVKQSADNMEKLGESSKEIGEIVSVIDDIADQTNLLALNAAIEAARAGEQGRGFAVVADEVRKLAERTTEATKQIANMIKGIQNETQSAVTAMNKGTYEVADGISFADQAGTSLKSVVDSSRLVQDMINQIAAASEEQSSTSEQIAKSVSTISHVTCDSARRIQDIAHSSEDLSKLTEQLRALVTQFRVDSNIDFDDRFSDSYRQLTSSSKRHLPAKS